MLDNPQSLAGIITKHRSKSVAQTVDRLTRVIADRGFMLLGSLITAAQPNELVCRCSIRNSSYLGSRLWARR